MFSAWIAALSVVLGLFWLSHTPTEHLPSLNRLYEGDVNEHTLKRLEYLYPRDAFPGGHDAVLPHGSTRYYRFGRVNDGEKIVMVHGIGIPCAVFGQLATLLAQHFDVLVYDLYGRGYSESPESKHDEALFTTQLALLTERIGCDSFHLVGYSMGGAVSASYATFFGARVKSITFIAPAGLLDEIPIAGRVFQLPGIGELFIRTGIAQYLMKKNAKENFLVQPGYDDQTQKSNPDSWLNASVEENVKRILDLTSFHIDHHPGFVYSFLSTVRHFSLTKLGKLKFRFESIGRQSQPVLVIWGTKDTLVPFSLWQDVKRAIPRANLVPIENGGHAIPVENATLLSDIIQGHINKSRVL